MTSRRVNDRRLMRPATDGRIYFLEQVQEFKNGGSTTRTHVVSLAGDGSGKRTHLRLEEYPEAADFSPNGRHLIVTLPSGGDSYLIPVPEEDRSAAVLSLEDSFAQRIASGPTTHVRWINDTLAVYGIGPKLASVRLGGGSADFHTIRLSLPRGRPAGAFAIRGARIITMAGEPGREKVIERGTILVRDGRIAAVGDEGRVSIPEGATTIDGSGLTIIPGLIDVHHHIGVRLAPRPFLDPDQISSLAYGVTGRYDPSTGSLEADLELHEKIETGATPGPRYYYSGPILSRPFDDLDASRKVLALYDTFDAAVIKDHGQHLRRSQQYLAQAAQERGVGITAHLGGLKEAMNRIMDGYTAIEHSPFIAPIYKDVAAFIARSGLNFTPNVISDGGINAISEASGVLMREMRRESPEDTLKYARFRWPDYYEGAIGDLSEPIRLTLNQLRVGRAARGAAKVIHEGGTVSIGSHNPPGIFSQWEMWLIHRGGASSMEVLRAATINGAKKIGIDLDVGSLEVGKLADFVVLTVNPLNDVRNTNRIRFVVFDGTIYDGDTMTKLWPEYRPLPRMGWQTEDQYAKLKHADPLFAAP